MNKGFDKATFKRTVLDNVKITAIMRIVRKDGCGNYARMQKMFVTPREK
jgi:hypothetical protein